MSTIIKLPPNDDGYEYAKVYKSDSQDGDYTLIDTINAVQLEYIDETGDYTSFYQIAWYDGTTESDKISVQSLVQRVIDLVRIECKVSESTLPDSEIAYLIEEAKKAIKIDLCRFKYGQQIYKLNDPSYYELPPRYYFDSNFGGVVSLLDVTLYKQAIPTYPYTPKVTVVPLDIDYDEEYVKVVPLESNEVLKISYFETTREMPPEYLDTLVAYKISAIYFENLASSAISVASSSPFAKVKIGDVSIENGTSSSAGTGVNVIVDLANKMNAKYTKLMTYFKSGFVRVN